SWKHDGDPRHIKFLSHPRGTLIAVAAMVLLSVAVFLTFLVSPVTAPKTIGSATILALAAGFWVCFGSFLVALGNGIQFPVVGSLVVLTLAFSSFNDNHTIRTLDRQNPPRLPLRDTLNKW